MRPAAPRIDQSLVRALVADQFPHWANLGIRAVTTQGWDNRTFHLGDEMVVRLPSDAAYATQVEKEHRWLPVLAGQLPLQIPIPLALGRPGRGYPWSWSIYRFIEGEPADIERTRDAQGIASTLAAFLLALHRVDANGGPAAGTHNFHRGGSLAVYDGETRGAIAVLAGRIDTNAAAQVWESALGSRWDRAPVWVHGDVSAGNLLLNDGRLDAVIDFGNLGTGDPACDLAVAWTLFEGRSRSAFTLAFRLDDATWARARGWALWKALIVAAESARTDAAEYADPWRVLGSILRDAARG